MQLPEYKCKRCGKPWHPRTNKKPDQCPKCKSYKWDEETDKPEDKEEEK